MIYERTHSKQLLKKSFETKPSKQLKNVITYRNAVQVNKLVRIVIGIYALPMYFITSLLLLFLIVRLETMYKLA